MGYFGSEWVAGTSENNRDPLAGKRDLVVTIDHDWSTDVVNEAHR